MTKLWQFKVGHISRFPTKNSRSKLICDVIGAPGPIFKHFHGHTTRRKQCPRLLDDLIILYSYTFSYTKMNAEFKKLCLVVWNSTLLPVWRHEMGIWEKLGTPTNYHRKSVPDMITTHKCHGSMSEVLMNQFKL